VFVFLWRALTMKTFHPCCRAHTNITRGGGGAADKCLTQKSKYMKNNKFNKGGDKTHTLLLLRRIYLRGKFRLVCSTLPLLYI
jgi:hypothetical protein